MKDIFFLPFRYLYLISKFIRHLQDIRRNSGSSIAGKQSLCAQSSSGSCKKKSYGTPPSELGTFEYTREQEVIKALSSELKVG